jgi:protein-tyrosine-phosphatase
VGKLRTVLFVCVHNAARSQMAEAFFNEMTGGRHRGISAGSEPAEAVNPDAVEAMAELGIDISGARPKRLTAEMVERADIVITMGCGENVCPVVPKEIADWELEDPSGKPLEGVREIRDQIRGKVVLLVEAISEDE